MRWMLWSPLLRAMCCTDCGAIVRTEKGMAINAPHIPHNCADHKAKT